MNTPTLAVVFLILFHSDSDTVCKLVWNAWKATLTDFEKILQIVQLQIMQALAGNPAVLPAKYIKDDQTRQRVLEKIQTTLQECASAKAKVKSDS
jgi:hypothetical protein